MKFGEVERHLCEVSSNIKNSREFLKLFDNFISVYYIS